MQDATLSRPQPSSLSRRGIITEGATIPFDADSEIQSLACVLCGDGDAAGMLARLEWEHFHDIRLQTIFGALCSLEIDGETLDTVKLYQRLRERGELDAAGGYEFVAGLPDKLVSAANFDSLLDVLKDRSARRAMLAEADELRRKASDLSAPVEKPKSGLVELLTERLYTPEAKHIEPSPRFQLAEISICTPGNLTAISAQAKAGKSAAISAMITSTFAVDGADCLGFESENPKELAVVHIDSEQCPFDHWDWNRRAARRARRNIPQWIRSYCLTGFLVDDLRKSVRLVIEESAKRFGGVHSVFIDGIADLVHDVNDPAEASSLVSELHGLAIEYDCPILGIIHVNPGSDFKTRGHLGSQLERKSETNLRLEKDANGITSIWADKNRRAPIMKNAAPRFAWSDEARMHVTIASTADDRRSAKAEAMIPLRDEVFCDRPGMRWSEIISAIETTDKCSRRTAERRVGDWSKFGLIEKGVAGIWTPKT